MDFQCPRNQYEIDQMKTVPYSSAFGSLQYAQVCTRPDLTFVTGLLGKYQSNLGIELSVQKVTVGAESDQQVNICSFAARCDRRWPSTQ